MLIFIRILSAASLNSHGSVLDSISLELLKEEKELYGQVRLYASLSWGIFSAATGALVDEFRDPFVIFYTFIVFEVLFCYTVTLVTLPNSDNSKKEEDLRPAYIPVKHDEVLHSDDAKIPLNSFIKKQESLLESFMNAKTFLFFISASLIGLVFAIIGCYLFIYLRLTWKASQTMMGMTTPFSILGELFVFFYSPLLLKKLGTNIMIISAHAVLLIRLALYCTLPLILKASIDEGTSYAFLFVN